jgi:hypothetical protein
MESDEPNWALITMNPTAFVGLSEGFQRNDLKRAYTSLIKRYKPEQFPSEFQRIRAAYEQLDHQLRYGSMSEAPLRTASPHDVSDQADVSVRHATSSTELDDTRMSTAAAESYQQLEKLAVKSPRDYYRLAVLADVVHAAKPNLFLLWIVRGLKQYPNDQGLLRLAYAALASGVANDAAPRVLPAICDAIRTDHFFALTESLWLHYMKQTSFDEFTKLLHKCESQISDHRVTVRVAFYSQLLRSAMFIAPLDWIRKTREFILAHTEYMPNYLEFDLEVTIALTRYREANCILPKPDTVRHYIHEAMVTYCQGSERAGNQAVVELQLAAVKNHEYFANAFPWKDNEELVYAWMAWEWVCEDVRQRLAMPVLRLNPQAREAVLKDAIDTYLRPAENARVLSIQSTTYWHLAACVVSVFAGLVLAVAICDFTFGTEYSSDIYLLIVPTVCLAAYACFGARPLQRLVRGWKNERLDGIYAQFWRPHLFRTIADLHGDYEFLVGRLQEIERGNRKSVVPAFHEVNNRIASDYGLAFYAAAIKFLN